VEKPELSCQTASRLFSTAINYHKIIYAGMDGPHHTARDSHLLTTSQANKPTWTFLPRQQSWRRPTASWHPDNTYIQAVKVEGRYSISVTMTTRPCSIYHLSSTLPHATTGNACHINKYYTPSPRNITTKSCYNLYINQFG